MGKAEWHYLMFKPDEREVSLKGHFGSDQETADCFRTTKGDKGLVIEISHRVEHDDQAGEVSVDILWAEGKTNLLRALPGEARGLKFGSHGQLRVSHFGVMKAVEASKK